MEKTAQDIEGRIRAMFLGLQERLKRKIDARQRLVAFIPEYAPYMMNRLSKGLDGKVAYERIKSKKSTVMGVEFGKFFLNLCDDGRSCSRVCT